MKTFHECDLEFIEAQREWEKAVNRADSRNFRNLMIAGVCGFMFCVLVVVWLTGPGF